MNSHSGTCFRILLVMTILWSGLSAESLKKSGTSLKTTRKEASGSTAYGSIDIRPQIDTSTGALSSESEFQLGLKWDWASLGYAQEVETPPSDSESSAPTLADGHIKFKKSGLWSRNRTSFDFEGRAYLPTAAEKQERGMITAIRAIFKFNQKLSEEVSFTFAETPIIHLYQDAGAELNSGPAANPAFENRVFLRFAVQMSKEVSFSFPIFFHTVRYRDYQPSAKLNDDWDPNFFIWPEIDVDLGEGFMVGVAYRSNNFISTTESGTVAADGLGNGVVQGAFMFSF